MDDTLCYNADTQCPVCEGTVEEVECKYCKGEGHVSFPNTYAYIIPTDDYISDDVIIECYKDGVFVFLYNEYYMASLSDSGDNYAALCRAWSRCGFNWLPIWWIEMLVRYDWSEIKDIMGLVLDTVYEYHTKLISIAKSMLAKEGVV